MLDFDGVPCTMGETCHRALKQDVCVVPMCGGAAVGLDADETT